MWVWSIWTCPPRTSSNPADASVTGYEAERLAKLVDRIAGSDVRDLDWA
jgi:hypothetical protein